MSIKDLRKKSNSDLEKLLADKRKALREFRFNISGGKIKNIKEGKNIKQEIARIFTLLKERELETNTRIVAKDTNIKAN